jgi:hypothetical protein
MSYAAKELNKLPVTEAVHLIKRHVLQHESVRKDGTPEKSPADGPNFTMHKEIAGKNPLEVDVNVDRNEADVLVQTKTNFWTNKHELGAFITMASPFSVSPSVRKNLDNAVILLIAVVGAWSGHLMHKACSMVFTAGHGFFGHVFGIMLLAVFMAVIVGTLFLIDLWIEWRDEETCTNLIHNGKLIQLEDDEAAEVFKRLSWCHRNLEVYETQWINRILDKMWPKLKSMLTRMVWKKLDQTHVLSKIKEKTRGYLELSVLRTSIGHHPPRVTGVRVLGDRSHDVIIDTEITFDDEMDISVEIEVRVYKFKPMVLCVGLRKFFLRLMMRIVVAPISSDLPLADSITMYLMERPSINWTFVGLGRILNIRFLQHLIEDLISSILLYPKAIQVKLLREYLTSEPIDTEEPVIIDLDMNDK